MNNNETELLKSAQECADEIIADARKQRELILAETGSLEDMRNRIKKFCLSKDEYSFMREAAEQIGDSTLYTYALKETKKELAELKGLPGAQPPTSETLQFALLDLIMCASWQPITLNFCLMDW